MTKALSKVEIKRNKEEKLLQGIKQEEICYITLPIKKYKRKEVNKLKSKGKERKSSNKLRYQEARPKNFLWSWCNGTRFEKASGEEAKRVWPG